MTTRRRPLGAGGVAAAAMMGLLLLLLLQGATAFVVPAPHMPQRTTAVLLSSEALTQEAPADLTKTKTAAAESSRSQVLDRVNFAIISHPDSGKTTLTEKLLLYGGAIQEAGAVRSRASQRKTQSDFMEMEKQRGISISSTVLSFQYAGFQINLLDTPGHADFGEDTYRTLAAADNALMLVDAGKGLEGQTRKLFEVCRLRNLPIYTFINKMDRPSRSPLELLDEIQEEMKIECVPIVWPIGDGPDFKGVLHRESREVHLYEKQGRTEKAAEVTMSLDDPALADAVGEELYKQLLEDVELLDGLMPPLDKAAVLAGKQTPLFFGSGINNFGVQLFLDSFLGISERPMPRESTAGMIGPDHPEFSGFVFKLVANLNPKHRDRVAFVRVVSGRFEKGMKVAHGRLKRQVNLAQASALFGQDRETIEEAYPGDVIGLNNPGLFSIGDSIYTGSKAIKFPGIPSFSPQIFAYIFNPNSGKYKNFRKGIDELLQEGAVQLLYERNDQGQTSPILAAVGQLQFEVVQYRLQEEYGVESRLEPMTFTAARWSGAGWDAVDKADAEGKIFGAMQCKDRWGRPVLLFRNEWKIQSVIDEAPYLELVGWMMAPEAE